MIEKFQQQKTSGGPAAGGTTTSGGPTLEGKFGNLVREFVNATLTFFQCWKGTARQQRGRRKLPCGP